MHVLVALRVVQGIAGGGVLVMSQAVVADAVPARERARFMAPVGLVFAVSSVVSPLLGGTLTDTVGWRWIFWVNLPLGALAWTLAYRAVPRRSTSGHGDLDMRGFGLYAVSVTGVVVLATGQLGSWVSPVTLVLVGVTAACGLTFARRMLTHTDPLIPIGVLRNRTVAVASCIGLVNGAAVFGLVGYLPTVVQSVLGLKPTMSGAILLALVLGMMVSTITTGRWTARTGQYRRLPLIGCLLGAGAMAWLSTLDASWGVGRAAAAIALLGLGAGFFMQVVTIAAQDAAPAEHVGSATSTVSLVRELGVTVGAASLGAAFAAHGNANDLGAGVAAAVPTVFTGLMVVLLAGAAVSLALPDRRLSSHVQ
jgi:MFS family permease